MNEKAKKVLSEKLWYVATCSGNSPTVIPIGFKTVTDDDKLVIADVSMAVTSDNVKNGSRVAIAATDYSHGMAFGVKGTAEYFEAGPEVDMLNRIAEENGYPHRAKGAIVVTPTHIFSTMPDPDNGKEEL